MPDPNSFGGPVRIRRPGNREWQEMALTHGSTGNSRGLAYHVLEIMHDFHEASEQGRHVELTRSCGRPTALPPRLPDWVNRGVVPMLISAWAGGLPGGVGECRKQGRCSSWLRSCSGLPGSPPPSVLHLRPTRTQLAPNSRPTREPFAGMFGRAGTPHRSNPTDAMRRGGHLLGSTC